MLNCLREGMILVGVDWMLFMELMLEMLKIVEEIIEVIG